MKDLHLLKNFSIFTIIGGFFFLIAVAVNSALIDVLALNPAVATFVVISVLFIAKYFVYLATRVIVPNFWRYTSANLFVTALSTCAIWFMVDYVGFSGAGSTAISLGFFFLLRYIVLYSSNVIRRGGRN